MSSWKSSTKPYWLIRWKVKVIRPFPEQEDKTKRFLGTLSQCNSPSSHLSQIVLFNHYSFSGTKHCGPFLLFLRFTVNMSRQVHGRTYPVAEAHSDLMRLLSVKRCLSLSISSIYEHKQVQERESVERSCCFLRPVTRRTLYLH